MKYLTCLPFAICTCIALGADFSVRPEGKGETIHSSFGGTAELRAAKLFFENKEGITGPAEEDYLVEVIDNDYPRIVDMLDGRISKIQLADVDGGKENELLVFYFAGGNQYGVRIYTINGIDVKPLKAQPVSSNMHSVQVKGNDIVVKNEEIGADGKRFVSVNTYTVVHGDCKRVLEEKSVGNQ
jgi:hypothetical protein